MPATNVLVVAPGLTVKNRLQVLIPSNSPIRQRSRKFGLGGP